MKQTFTLITLMVLVILFAFGQGPEIKNIERSGISRFDSRLKGLNPGDKHGHQFLQNRLSTQVFRLKSAQAIKQRLDSYSSLDFDKITNQWIQDFKSDFTYDANLNLTQELDYDWDKSTNQWIQSWKGEYTFDISGKLTQELYSVLDETTNQFSVFDKSMYTYDASGNQLQELYYQIDENTGQLAVKSKYDYTYDVNRHLTLEIRSDWDSATNQWTLSDKEESSYDSNGNLLRTLSSRWYGINQWIVSSKDEYIYDSEGHLIQDLYYSMTNNPQGELRSKDVYAYDDKGNMIQVIYYGSFDVQANDWMSVSKTENTYDNKFTMNDLILPIEFKTYFTHLITEINDYDLNIGTQQWVHTYQTTFNYSEANVTSVSSLEAELSKVYPNPFTESVSFSIPGAYSQTLFELFDLQGRTIISKEINNIKKVGLEGLNSGMYLYKLKIDGKIQSGKLIKK